jgi:hypothetical protein
MGKPDQDECFVAPGYAFDHRHQVDVPTAEVNGNDSMLGIYLFPIGVEGFRREQLHCDATLRIFDIPVAPHWYFA